MIFYDLADEDWRIEVDEHDINEPTLCYADPDSPGRFVGPLVRVHVGATVEDEDGDEVLDLDAADGRNLAAVACLPQMVGLMRWAEEGMDRLNAVHFDSATEYGRFMRELRKRLRWIRESVDERPMTMNPGMHGFEKFHESAID